MSDVITKLLKEAKRKGKLNRLDVIMRYLRMKYRLKLTEFVLEKRIQTLLSGRKQP